MAAKKRATKKKTSRQSAPPRKTPTKKKASRLKRFRRLAWVGICLSALALGAIYYFGSFETRAKLNDAAMRSLNTLRSPTWMPRLITRAIDPLYDAVPSSEGLIVDGGELGRSDSPILAGMPQSRSPIRILKNQSYINLYDETRRQARCIAFRLSDSPRQKVERPTDYQEDPRVRRLRANEMTASPWSAHPIAPPAALAGEFGQIGTSEAHLTTLLAPMPPSYAAGLWKDAMETVADQYPKRFGEIWIYAGPAYGTHQTTLSSGIPLPDAFYLIAFDLTDAGGLRALSFLIPTDAEKGTTPRDCLTSIETIERQTGLQFLPELSFDARGVLRKSISPNLW